MSTTNQQLCDMMPDRFLHYLDRVQSLKYDEEPEYDLYIKFFEEVLGEIGVM